MIISQVQFLNISLIFLQAALKAFKKDLTENPSLAAQYGIKPKGKFKM